MTTPAPGRPTTRDDTTRLPEYEDLTYRLRTITAPCTGGTEWFSEDPRHQARAATLCRACLAQPACRAYALAAGETEFVWGGLTPAQLRARQRQQQAQAA